MIIRYKLKIIDKILQIQIVTKFDLNISKSTVLDFLLPKNEHHSEIVLYKFQIIYYNQL